MIIINRTIMSDENMVSPTPEEAVDNTTGNEEGKDVKSLQAQKEHFRTKFEDSQKELEELKAKAAKVEVPEAQPTPELPKTDDARLEKIEFTIAHPELGAEAIQEVFDLAKTKGIAPDKALESPVLAPYLEQVKQERKVANASPTTGRSPKVTPAKPLAEMTRDERIEHHAKLVEGLK